MGINYGTAMMLSRILVFQKYRDASSQECKVMTLGHQKMSLDVDKQKYNVITSFKTNGGISVRRQSLLAGTYSDDFLMDIGATSIDTLDYSDFEGCSYVRNLNISFSRDDACTALRSKYDVVLDFGTSEHVFNMPRSIANSIYMLRPGGGFVLVLPVCGWLEHGFYQFSPNFFRSLNIEGLILKKWLFSA